MNDELLKNIHDHLIEKKLTTSDFDTWKSNISKSNEVQTNVFNYLSKNKLTTSDFDTWKDNVGLKKKDISQSSGEVQQEVSPIQPKKKTSLLGGGNQEKVQSASGSSVGKSKVQIPYFDNMDISQLAKFDKGEDIIYSQAGRGVVAKKDKNNEVHFKNFMSKSYNEAVSTLSKITPTTQQQPVNNQTFGKNFHQDILAPVTQEDRDKIDQDYKDALNEKQSFWFNTKKTASNILNTAITAVNPTAPQIQNKSVLDVYREQVKKEAAKNKETLLPGQVEYRVKQKFYEDRLASITDSKINSLKESLTPAQQYAIGQHKLKDYTHLSDENKTLVKSKSELISTTKALIEQKKGIEKQFKGKLVPPDVAQQYEHITNSITQNNGIIKHKQDLINQNNKDLGNISDEIKAWTSNNQELTEIGQGFGGWLTKAAGNVLSYQASWAKRLPKQLDPLHIIQITGEAESKLGDKLKKKGKEISEGVEIAPDVRVGGITREKEINQGHVLNGILNHVTSWTADNVGMVASTFAGTGGVAFLAGETAGEKESQIQEENKAFEEAKQDAIKNNEKTFEFDGKTHKVTEDELHSTLAQVAVPILYGGATILPIAKNAKLFRNEMRVLQSVERESPDLLVNAQKNAFIESAKRKGAKYLAETVSLGKDFKIMKLTQAVADDFGLGKKQDYVDIVTDLGDFRDAAVFHGANKIAAYAMGQGSRPYMTNKEAKTLDNNSAILIEGVNKLSDPNISEEEKTIIKNHINRVAKESQVHIDNVVDRMGEMSNQDYKRVADLAKKSSELRLEASSIQNSDMPLEQKKIALEGVKKDYLQNEAQLKDFVENYSKRTDGFYGLNDREKIPYLDKASKELKAEAEANGEKAFNFSSRDINIKAQEIYNLESNPKYKSKKVADEIIKNNVDTGEGIKEMYDSYDEVPDFLKPLAKEFGKNLEVKVGLFGKKLKVDKYSVVATPEEIQKAYDDFYKTKEVKEKEYTPFEEVTLKETKTSDVINEEVKLKEKEEKEIINSGQKVSDFVNRPATLESYGGSKLNKPIDGDLYIEGQRVIFEDKNNKIYDLGNVDEISDNNVEDIGIKPIEINAEITSYGKVLIDGNEWNMQMELPTKGIEYDKDGNITRVSLKDNQGKTKMWDGQMAEDIGYQILLKEVENPEIEQQINETLKNDEQFQNRVTEVENSSEERTNNDNEKRIAENKSEEPKPTRRKTQKEKLEEVEKEVPLQKVTDKNLDDIIKELGIEQNPCNI